MNARLPSGPCMCGGCATCLKEQGINPDDQYDDDTLETLAEIRAKLDDAEMQHELGHDDVARERLRSAMFLIDVIVNGVAVE